MLQASTAASTKSWPTAIRRAAQTLHRQGGCDARGLVRWLRATTGYYRRTLGNRDGWCHLVPRRSCSECRYFWTDAHTTSPYEIDSNGTGTRKVHA